jgi:tetratricopeptide (TPR) repeat protein
MDPNDIKELLTTGDVAKLEETVRSFDNHETATEEEERQLIKLRILIWNRICGLQQAAGKDTSHTFRNIGKCWMDMGEIERAVGQLKKAIEAKPGDAVCLELLGEAYAETADYQSALDYLNKAVMIREQKADDKKSLALCYGKLANTCNMKCDFVDAVQFYEKAESTMKDAGLAGCTEAATLAGDLGRLLEKTGEYEKAVEVFTRAHKALCALKGEADPQTEEIEYLLEMASNLVG